MELPVHEIRRIEREALARGVALMPRAGLAAARFAAARLAQMGQANPADPVLSLPVLALAGPGNNGGDALVAATWLRAWGHPVQVVLYADPDRLPADARLAYDGWRQAGGSTLSDLPANHPALALDGLFGIGLNRPLDEIWQARVDTINGWNIPVLALDVPSGLDASSGRELGRAVRAAWTLSFIACAPGLGSPAGLGVCGERHLDTLGLA
ncbi:Nicotinamide nucleotide repair protein [Bordetella ansorpii]|uniref:NAD(P)H-hydrate epimerase n=1 Tax=Bordetella ansorpii TaxID=288768 RepID=A0A157MXS3_9BORD|nr:NAD(P)H-hydrate epimerase [Bordetella ansorpii]SAI13773.1 Nicotinamide nucleotide repair protein [Bordetella ansorpii]